MDYDIKGVKMSVLKNKKLYICMILAFVSLLIFGCENRTPVEDIAFREDEIVLLVGESYTPSIALTPSYATNTSYTLSSSNSSIVSVNGNSILAVSAGNTTIRVRSNDNELLEDVMTVSVREHKTVLDAPRNLIYNESNQSFSFDSVNNASSYTIKINGHEINLGNSNSYTLSQYNLEFGNAFDTVLTVQVRANAPTYSQAFINSEYTAELKIYQNSSITSAHIQNGILSFEKNANSTNYSILINGDEYSRGSDSIVDLTTIPEIYAGMDVTVGIVSLVNSETRAIEIQGVTYYDSLSYNINARVLDVTDIDLNISTVSWNNVSNASSYSIYIDDVLRATTTNNYIDLRSLDNFESIINNSDGYHVRVEPEMSENSINILKSSKQSESIQFNRYAEPTLTVENNMISWQPVENATIYSIELVYGENTVRLTTTSNSFSLNNYPSGMQYQFSVYIEGQYNGDVYYLASPVASETIDKQTEISASISDYILSFNAEIGANYKIEFNTSDGGIVSENITADTSVEEFDLSTYTFAYGLNEIKLTHLGDGSTIFDSNAYTLEVIQLETIDSIDITNGTAVVDVSEINESADIRFVITGDLGKEYEVSANEYVFNTTDQSLESYLPADSYTISVYVYGNGENTFSVGGRTPTVCAEASFEVLDIPTLTLPNKDETTISISEILGADSYNIYVLQNDEYVLLDEEIIDSYNFILDNGEMKIKVQSVGDGTNYLNSVLSQEQTIIRLATPTLTYDNSTDVISRNDPNLSGVEGYTFMFKAGDNEYAVNNYAFDGTAFTEFVVGENRFKIKANAIDASNNTFYLNSYEYELIVNMIDNTSEITVNEFNQLVISPTNQTEEYNLNLIIGIDEDMSFVGSNGTLTYNDYTLTYYYEDNSYYINLLNEDYTPIINEMISNFNVRVKFIKESSGDDTTANSAFTSNKLITILASTNASREGQYIVFNNVAQTYTYLNYAILINDNYVLDLDNTSIIDVDSQTVRVAVDYIYENADIPSGTLLDINKIAIITKNINSTVDSPLLSAVGDHINIARVELAQLTSQKDNEATNNSVQISFTTTDTEFTKEYVVQIYNLVDGVKSNLVEYTYQDDDALENIISFNLDERASTLTGEIYISYYVLTNGYYDIDGERVYVFNSASSNELMFTKIDSVTNIIVSGGNITFDPVENAIGYEIYRSTASGYQKINSNLLTSTSYNLANETGSMTLFVKAVSLVGFTNSNLSEGINVNKLATPTFSVENGMVVLTLSNDAVTLLQDEAIATIHVENGTKICDLNLENEGVSLVGNKLYIEPYLILRYGESSILEENVSFNINVTTSTAGQELYYLNSNVISVSVYGLLAPTNTQKYISQEDNVEIIEHISWVGNANNILNSTNVGYGYIMRIVIKGAEGEEDLIYYSSDSRLKFVLSDDNLTLNSYASVLQELSTIFPYGYDLDNDGTISEDEIFKAGEYHISIKAVPIVLSGYNLLASAYSYDYIVNIMETPYIDVASGSLIWQEDELATGYIVRIFDSDFTTELTREVITSATFDFSNNDRFNDYVGLYGISVQSISSNQDVINSEISDIIQVFRMPVVDSVTVDDGNLVISANRFFSAAEIEFVDSVTNSPIWTYVRSEEEVAGELTSLGISSWSEYNSDIDQLNTINKYVVEIDGTSVLNILENRSYKINIKLVGNSNRDLSIISSAKTNEVSELTGTKLNTNLFEVTKGVLQFTTPQEYQPDELNYNFNNQDILDENSFWNDTIVYKITITTPNTYEIYAVDYYKFITARDNNILSSEDYEILEGETSNLYAYVRFAYSTVEGSTEYLYFNVFYENLINLKDYDQLYYYPINVTQVNGEFNYTGAENNRDFATINLSNGGSFVIMVNILGGDSKITYSDLSTISSHSAYLTANTNTSNTFIRYSENLLTSYLGQVSISDQRPTNDDGIILDNPVYELTITRLNTENSTIVYLYYDTGENAEADARTITGNETATYVPIVFSENNAILFNMSDCLDSSGNYLFTAGNYEITVRTIAGLGNSEIANNSSDYLLNSKAPTYSQIYNKISNTSMYAENGVLKFALSSISSGENVTYIYDYEITIIDAEGESYTYQISRYSDGVSIDSANNIVTYALPSTIEIDENNELNIQDGVQYAVKVKALAQSNQYVLNGSYVKDNSVDREFDFTKSLGISTSSGENLRIEDGMLKWKVLDLTNYTTVTIQITFLDANMANKTITFTTTGNRYEDENGQYLYHYYTFLDDRYNLDDGSGSVYIDSGIIYYVKLYVAGTTNSSNAVLNSNYSTEIQVERLARITNAELLTQDGELTWNSVQDAANYIVTLTSSTNSYTFTTTSNVLDISETLDDADQRVIPGDYTITIRVMGNNKINSILTTSTNTFTKLSAVENISIDSSNRNNIRWDISENAQGYLVRFEYNIGGEPTEYETILNGVNNNSISAPTDMSGQYTVYVMAIGIGQGYVFNSDMSSYTSSKDVPNPVGTILYDEDNYRYYWTTASDFSQGDRLRITYQFRPYIQSENGITLSSEEQMIIVNYTYNQACTYYIENDIRYYYYAPTVMGAIRDFTVQVEREDSLYSSTSRGEDKTINIYSIGAGTSDNPYGIDSVDELLRIDHFDTAYFELLSAINFSGTDVAELIASNGAIIASSFSGTLDGQAYALYGFNNINLQNVTQFALFGELNDATIKNIVIGESSIETIITNTFANSINNVVNLSMIASNAINSTIEDITLYNITFVVNGTGTLASSVYIGGLVGISSNTTISGSILDVGVQFNADFTSYSYIGGIVGQATNTTINSSTNRDTNVLFELSQTMVNRTFNYVGGAVGYLTSGDLTGTQTRSGGIFNATVEVTFNNIYANYLGGVVGLISRAEVNSITVNGTITHLGISNVSYIGGVAGTNQSGIITESNINLTFDVVISNAVISECYIGALAGRLVIIGTTDCQVTNCVIDYPFIDCTVLSSNTIESIGIYGYRTADTNVIVSGCTQSS